MLENIVPSIFQGSVTDLQSCGGLKFGGGFCCCLGGLLCFLFLGGVISFVSWIV